MSDSGKSFELGGVVVPLRAALNYDQQFEPVESASFRRMANGTGIKQTAWSGKLRVVLSGDGWAPIGLADLDYGSAMPLRCGMPEAVRANTAVIALPGARRTDAGYTPFAHAYMPDGSAVETAVAVVGDVATCTSVTNAIGYAVWYWPELTVIAQAPTRGASASRAEFTWQIVCEEA